MVLWEDPLPKPQPDWFELLLARLGLRVDARPTHINLDLQASQCLCISSIKENDR